MVLKGFAIPKEAWDDTLHVETRLDRIEELMAQLAESQAEAWHSQALANRSIDRLSMRVDQLTVRVDKVSQDGEVRDFLKVFRTFLPEYREKKDYWHHG
jgi:ribosome assembly protein YihI (activator of Der GTPase)